MTGYSDWRKSTRSNGGEDSNCIECRVTWRKSTRSNGGDDSSCIEARQEAGAFQVRDSKLGHDSPIFDLASTDFRALLTAAELPRNQAQGPPREPRGGGLASSNNVFPRPLLPRYEMRAVISSGVHSPMNAW